MTIWSRIQALFTEPPPAWAFEVSEKGLAWANTAPTLRTGFEPFTGNPIAINPLTDNILDPTQFAATLARILPPNGRLRPAAVILPDHAGRIAVLEFDSFPSDPEEQRALVRFRVKKSVPFDADAAAISHAVQWKDAKRCEVVAAVVSLEIAARYESQFRAAGFQPGLVTTSALASLPLLRGDGVSLSVRLAGSLLSLAVVHGARLKLVRSVTLPELTADEVNGVLYPTVAYVEDELGGKPARILTTGIDSALLEQWNTEFGIACQPLRVAPESAGLAGYLNALPEAA
ncbi:MAG: hypothetical protein MUC42_13340 [Bryobacter sp.]|jgi:type IV pilus assembly protein PilM|nr:hypothetical protein [Bryobacter sp.]